MQEIAKDSEDYEAYLRKYISGSDKANFPRLIGDKDAF